MNWSGQHCWVSTTLLSSASLGICLLLLFQNTGTAERLQILSLCPACAHYDCWFHSQAADDYFLILLRNIHAGLKAPAKNTTGFQFSSLLLSSNFRCWKIMKELSCPVWMNECVQDITVVSRQDYFHHLAFACVLRRQIEKPLLCEVWLLIWYKNGPFPRSRLV